MHFTIDEEYITDIHFHKEWGMFDKIPKDQLTHEQLIKIIKGEDRCSMSGSKEHPEFLKLRDILEEQGYIKTERSWSNGDRVLKDFTLNGFKFIKNSTFFCAAALKSRINYCRKQGIKNIGW
jgi:hypothetical protein